MADKDVVIRFANGSTMVARALEPDAKLRGSRTEVLWVLDPGTEHEEIVESAAFPKLTRKQRNAMRLHEAEVRAENLELAKAAMPPDYRELLKKYMRHVVACEGVSYVDHADFDNNLAAADHDELQKIEKEIWPE